ncbi:CpaF family protein [Youngiibacter multivorans]|uniref:Pilus assembly protein CpaF n=1 Tax=Youngiibacter multivorans TaxID=937251 RepID=A0ABS4G8E1_9CLOT|nr:CpaF family protein [Youngiibacter multivorans]MBP1920799.1 pilus assembly protein CpaF [Youngiibacter multivorans]
MAFGTFGVNGIKKSEPVVEEKESTSELLAKKKKELDDLSYEVLGNVIDQITLSADSNDIIQKRTVQEKINETINSILFETKRHLSLGDKQRVNNSVMDEIFGYGPITILLNDPTVTEVMVNGPKSIFVERSGKILKTEHTFRDDRHVMHIIDKIIAPLGRRVDESSPLVDARLPDGSRVNIIIPPLSIKGPAITIRKFSVDPFTLEDLIAFGTLNGDMAKLLRASVRGRVNVLVSGGTGSGKTTLLNVLSGFIPDNERIVTVEDAAELQLQQEHVVTLEARPANIEGKGRITIRDLVVNTLRMRPDRIVVGEVRSGEALDMLQAMNTGHDGSLTTIHANTPRDSLARLETMVMMSGMELPSRAIREQITSAINLIVQVGRFTDGTRKIMKITEIVGMESDTITLQDIYIFRQEGFNERGGVIGKHVPTGIVPNFLEKIKAHGDNIPASVFKTPEINTETNQRRY